MLLSLILSLSAFDIVWCDFHSTNSLLDPSDDFSTNFHIQPCFYNRQCDESYGYICRGGKCACTFGRPDPHDLFKCKVEIGLGDYCAEIPRSKRDRRMPYVRRKCPHSSECGDQGTCDCSPLFKRKGGSCLPKMLLAGGKACRKHLDCMVNRGQQCFNGTCVECSVGRFKNFRPSAKWVVPNPECVCFDRGSEPSISSNTVGISSSENPSHNIRHKKGTKKGTCIPPLLAGDHCTVSHNCRSAWTPQFDCFDGTCQCPPGSKEYSSSAHPLSTSCISPINSACSGDRDCHPATAYCEMRLEVPACKCKEGYVPEGKNQFYCVSKYYEETCGKFYPLNENIQNQIREQRLSCIQGLYDCAYPREMFWDKSRGKCVSLVGGRCDLDQLDSSGCAGISRCWEYKGTGEQRCQCPLSRRDEGERAPGTKGGNEDGPEVFKFKLDRDEPKFRPSRDRRNCIRI